MTIGQFRKRIWDHYAAHGRHDMAWRKKRDPYRIVVSEVMLQQTQVARVEKKYPEFIAAFPGFASLAKAPLKDVLAAWQGMGYNRRALYLKRIAEEVVREHGGILPHDPKALEKLPGIGHATARSIAAFAFDAPVAFIETNIRSVFLRHFFPGRKGVKDAQILPFVERALDRARPREWHWALMDYGTHMKGFGTNPSRASAHHGTQEKFAGSDRQARGAIVRALLASGPRTIPDIVRETGMEGGRVRRNMANLEREGLVGEKRGKFVIP